MCKPCLPASSEYGGTTRFRVIVILFFAALFEYAICPDGLRKPQYILWLGSIARRSADAFAGRQQEHQRRSGNRGRQPYIVPGSYSCGPRPRKPMVHPAQRCRGSPPGKGNCSRIWTESLVPQGNIINSCRNARGATGEWGGLTGRRWRNWCIRGWSPATIARLGWARIILSCSHRSCGCGSCSHATRAA